MAKYTMGESIIISVVIGSILLYLLGISGIFSLIIMGFVATYLTIESQRSYSVGGIAGAFLGIVLFVFSFLTPPDLPYSLTLSINFLIGGIFTLGLGFVVLLIICFIFGSIGGLIAVKLLKKRVKPMKHERNNNRTRLKNNKPRKARNSFQRNYK